MLPLEQAALSRTVAAGRRTETYARYNILASLAVACGALAAPGAAWLARHLPFAATTADVVFVLYAALGTALFALYLSLHEVDDPAYGRGTAAGATPAQRGLSESRGVVYRLTAMFGFDAMAGGLVVQGLISLWLHTRYGVGVNVLGPLFFVTNLCSALSLLAAAPLARRFGLLNTMVFGHLPSDLFLFLVAFAPSFPVAAVLLMLRSSFAQLDVPTRQAYTMELVKPGERSAAAGLTASARGIASSLSPTLAGWASALGFGLPFALAGSMKAVYDLALFAMFRHVPLRVDNDTPPVAQG